MTTFGNGYDKNKELDKQLTNMTERELDTLLLNLAVKEVAETKKTTLLSIDTSKYITPWTSSAGRAYAKWAAQMLVDYPKSIPTKDVNFLHSIIMKAIMLSDDNVHHLRWLGDRYKIVPTTGDDKRDAAIWSYVYGHVTWGEMKMGKSVGPLYQIRRR